MRRKPAAFRATPSARRQRRTRPKRSETRTSSCASSSTCLPGWGLEKRASPARMGLQGQLPLQRWRERTASIAISPHHRRIHTRISRLRWRLCWPRARRWTTWPARSPRASMRMLQGPYFFPRSECGCQDEGGFSQAAGRVGQLL